MKFLKTAVVASRSRFLDTEYNLNHFEEIIKEASYKGARFICFPELAVSSYTLDPGIFNTAETIPGRVVERVEKMAAGYGVYLSMGMSEKDNARYYITQVVTGPDGYMGKYRKYHITEDEKKAGFSEGNEFTVFDIDGFCVGINICYDGRWKDTIEAMKQLQVDLIHHPHGNIIRKGKKREADEWTRTKMTYFTERAIFASCYILVHNSAGITSYPEGINRFTGGAVIIDPSGKAVSRTTNKTLNENIVYGKLKKLRC